MSYVATMVIAILLSFIVVKQYLVSTPQQAVADIPVQRVANASQQVITRPPQENLVGKSVPLDLNWKDNKKTLVLYISTICRYCTESAPFYQRLVAENSRNGVNLVAVFPQSIEEAKEYLQTHNVNIDQVYNNSLNSISVRATPTLMLVDENGVVTDFWRGKLTADREAEVMAKLSS